MVFAVLCYLAAFTASSIDLIQTAALDGLQEIQTNTCQQMRWEFVTQISEVLIIVFGLHLAIASRNASTQYRVSYWELIEKVQKLELEGRKAELCKMNVTIN